MKMKKILYLFIVTIAFISCDDALEEKPKSIMDPNQFYTSDAEALSGLTGVYNNLYNLYANGPSWDYGYWVHLGTDLARPTGGRENVLPFHIYTVSNANENSLRAMWKNMYAAVGDANQLIDRVNVSSNVDENLKKRIIAEAKFLRAHYFYILTLHWGDVPMWLNELDVEEVGGAIKRTPVKEVYAQIIKDLKEAETNLPSSYSGKDYGRATKWAAKILMAKVYLWEKEWKLARDKSAEIIAQKEGPHKLMDKYEDIFGVDNEQNAEIIFEIDYKIDVHSSFRVSRYMPRQMDEPMINVPNSGFGLITSSEEFLSTFDSEDSRKVMYDYHGQDQDQGEVTNFHYVWKNMDWDSPRGNGDLNTLVYRLADAYLMYAEAENEFNGPSSEAYSKINDIRDRAFNYDESKRLKNLSKEEFRQAIMDERKWELAFEYHRRWDLNRWGKLVEAVKSNATTNPDGAKNVKDYHRLFPVPIQEIKLNEALLPNNTGY
ncbi:MAG: RagB/SusD family nutrient uptake outer membrane protein [Marinilabiliaceae bacterium]|nr:RagB/SusD family nutrient uptake outer membrane protein [Marinilabiliaceae bacterium]